MPILNEEGTDFEDAMHEFSDHLDSRHRFEELPEDPVDVSELREQNRRMRKALRRAVVALFRSNQPHMTHDVLATLKEMNEALR